MRFSFATLALLVIPTLAAPTVLKTVETAEKKVDGSYIVTLNAGVDKDSHLAGLADQFGADASVTHNWNATFVNGFTAKLNSKALNYLRAHPEVSWTFQSRMVTQVLTWTLIFNHVRLLPFLRTALPASSRLR
jgi:hypothetical protein